MPLAAGTTFAGYTIIRLLGVGAMGEVYLAQHPRLPRQDALKIMRADVSADEDYRQRFLREADLAARLWHPNIVALHDRGEDDDQLWLSMDYVDGTDAASLLRDRYPAGMPPDEVEVIVAAIASALDYAHEHDLLHRDVKPANILLTHPGRGDQRILLSDFGIARTLGDISGLTATNMTIGTLPYAAPEQLMDRPMDGRADQYSLAATAYHLLTGSPLFPESSPAAVIGSHLTTPPPALAASRPELAALDSVLGVALAKAPADRFARCGDFAAALTEVTHSGGQATSWAATMQAAKPTPASIPPGGDSIEKPRRSRRGMLLAAAATLVVLTAAAVIGYVSLHRHTTPSAATPPAATPPGAAVLDGTYRLDNDYTKMTVNSRLSPFGGKGPRLPSWSDWYGFRSACTAAGCVASGTKLDRNNLQAPDPNLQEPHPQAINYVLRWVEGAWQSADRTYQGVCSNGGGPQTEIETLSMEPQPDGTYQGTDTTVGAECGGTAGDTTVLPFVAWRIGPPPPGVVADPPTGRFPNQWATTCSTSTTPCSTPCSTTCTTTCSASACTTTPL